MRRWVAFFLASPLFRQAGVYTVSHLASKAVPFLLLPVLTRYLSPADYGIVAMFLLTTMVIEPFIALGFAGAVTVKYYDKATDLPSYVSTGLGVVALASIPFGALIFVFRNPISDLTAVPSSWLMLIVFLILARTLSNVVFSLWRVQERAVTYGIFQNLHSAALVGMAVVFVVVLGRQWQGRVEAELIAWSILAIISVVHLRRRGYLSLTFVKPYARQILRFGVPLIPHSLGAVFMAQTDRLFVTNMIGVDETGLYTVGLQLTLVIELVAVSFNHAYSPWLFKKLADGDADTKAKLVRYTYWHFAGIAAFAAVVALVMPPFAELILDERYAGSGQYVRWLAIGFACSGGYYMVANYIFYTERTGWLSVVTFTTATLNIPLTYFLIRENGAVGAAQATASALALSFVLTWIVSARVYPMPWRRPR